MRASRPPFSASRRTTMRKTPPPVPRKTLSNGYIKYNTRLRQSLGIQSFAPASLQWRESTDMPETSLYPPESALTWGSADATSVQETRIELALRNTKFRSVSSARTPEFVPSPGSSLSSWEEGAIPGSSSSSWGEGAIPRPNPTTRGDFPAHSMYVDENGDAHVNVHPDEFPLPPPIFPLPPPRTSDVALPKLRVLTGTEITSDMIQSAGFATPRSISLRRRNSYNSNQSEQPVSGVPSVVYGSDIVAASGSRNMLYNPSLRQGTLRSSTIGEDFVDDSTDEYLDMPERSGRSSQFITTPLPGGKGLSSGRTFNMGESDKEGSRGSVAGKRSSFAIRDKGKLKSAGKKVSIALTSRRSRRANSVDGSGTPLRSAGSGAAGDGGQWGTVPIMVVEPIPTTPISAPVYPTGPLYLGLLSPSFLSPVDKGTDSGMERRTDGGIERGTDRGIDRGIERGSSRGMSSAVRGGTRTRLVPRGPRSPEQGNTFGAEEGRSRTYIIIPEGGSFVKQD